MTFDENLILFYVSFASFSILLIFLIKFFFKRSGFSATESAMGAFAVSGLLHAHVVVGKDDDVTMTHES